MFEALNAQMEQLLNQAGRFDVLQRQADDLRQKRKETQQELTRLRMRLGTAQDEASSLESKNLRNFFSRATGRIRQKRAFLQNDIDLIGRRIEEVSGRSDMLTEKIEQLETAAFPLRDSRREYDQLYAQKLEALESSDSPLRQTVLDLESKASQLKGSLSQVENAMSEGRRAQSIITQIEESLTGAENWSVFDLAMRGGVFTHIAKHDRLSQAQSLADRLQKQIALFNSQLDGLKSIRGELCVQCSEFLRFADWFFDGFFVDWAVLSRVRDAKAQTAQLRASLGSAMSKLEKLRTALGHEILTAKADLKRLVLEAK